MNKRLFALFSLCVFYVLLCSYYWDVLQIWDARYYYQALLAALEQPFDILNFGAGGHLTQGFFLIMSLPYFIFKENYCLFNVWLTFFSLISIVSFYYLLKYFSRDTKSPFELALTTALFAFHPTIISNMIHFNADFGVLTFFLFFWLMLFHKRYFLASIFAILMLFSKEIAVVLFPIPFLFSFFDTSVLVRWQWVKKNIYQMVFPVLILAMFFMYKVWGRSQNAIWKDWNQPPQNHISLTHPDLLEYWRFFFWHPTTYFFNYLVIVLILNFNWIIFFFLMITLFRRMFLSSKQRLSVQTGQASLTFCMFLLSLYFTTLVTPLTNPRYLMVPITLMLLGAAQWFWISVARAKMRIIILSGMLILFLASDFRTIDPFSKAYFGVFSAGRHDMLSVSWPTRECSWYGRDQLVYNLEFLNFPRLLQKFMQDFRPTERDWVVVNYEVPFFFLTDLDRGTYKMTLQQTNIVHPHYIHMVDFTNYKYYPPDIHYLAFPNVDIKDDMNTLDTIYEKQSSKTYDVDGYQMKAIHYWQLKGPINPSKL